MEAFFLSDLKRAESIMRRENAVELCICYQSLASLKLCSSNARTQSKHQISQIADSIREFGFTNPILVDRDNVIRAGHGRAKAADQLGLDQVPTIRLETLTADQLRAYVIADNRLAEKAGWGLHIIALETTAELRRSVQLVDEFSGPHCIWDSRNRGNFHCPPKNFKRVGLETGLNGGADRIRTLGPGLST